ncbi:MAG: hypothetical protein ACFFG0_08150 [Candidatus Thorarchaeota archaeon]
MKPEYLMLAKTYKDQNIGGWFCSEKLDGTRAFWDGGISKGIPAKDVPYANTIKDSRLKEQPIATGLWSRSGKVIHAPDWWCEYLPPFFVDGELWMGYGRFQSLRSEVASQDGDWDQVQYFAFGCPNSSFLEPRKIKIRGGEYDFEIKKNNYGLAKQIAATPATWGFIQELKRLEIFGENDIFKIVPQIEVPFRNQKKWVQEKLERVIEKGGEGLVFRNKVMPWETCRSHFLLKHKPYFDCEVTIVGFTSGRETDKGSKHLGKIGALVTELADGKQVLVSGLTDEERELKFIDSVHAKINPGKYLPTIKESVHFKVGQTITIKYRELSDDGIPKEASFWRKRV